MASNLFNKSNNVNIRGVPASTKTVNLCGRKLKKIPKQVCTFYTLVVLELRNNSLDHLPKNFCQLTNLKMLNLGNNIFKSVPEVLGMLPNLVKLHLFNNKLEQLDGKVLECLKRLTFLNVNGNMIKFLPRSICRLENLKVLSVSHNMLEELPVDICLLYNLTEIYATNNQITSLPLEIGLIQNLQKLYLSKNKLKELPEGLAKLNHLSVLDVAANDLRIFPTEVSNMTLRELYCEANPLLQEVAVHSVQEEEVLSLKEISARFIMREIKENRSSLLRDEIRHYADAREILSPVSRCAVCQNAFLNTWLECVHFTKTKQLKTTACSEDVIPVRALLCSYKCFNTTDHTFYGVAFP